MLNHQFSILKNREEMLEMIILSNKELKNKNKYLEKNLIKAKNENSSFSQNFTNNYSKIKNIKCGKKREEKSLNLSNRDTSYQNNTYINNTTNINILNPLNDEKTRFSRVLPKKNIRIRTANQRKILLFSIF